MVGTLEDGLTRAEATGDQAAQATLLGRLAIESVRGLQLDEALSRADRAVELARPTGDVGALVGALDGLKLAALSLGDLDRVAAAVTELEGLLRAEGIQFYLQHALAEHGVEAAARGRWAEAYRLSDEAIETNRQHGLRHRRAAPAVDAGQHAARQRPLRRGERRRRSGARASPSGSVTRCG